ncbi:MAG: AAA family ATPase, partial [Trichodesmium sp. St19_bin1]|nr:AAA family ATPase [Trichodesmium sp. St19_bin1]
MAVGVVVSVALGVALGVAGGVAFGVAYNVAFGVAYGVARGVRLGVWLGAALGVAFGVAYGVALHAVIGIPVGLDLKLGVVLGLAGGLVGYGARWRPGNWFIGVPLNSISIQNRSFLLPRVTPIPLPLLKNRLKLWLRKDWQLGIENIDQLFKYSLQFIPVVNAINDVLAEIPSEQIIYRISQLAENPYDWKLVKFSSASLEEERIRLDTPSRTTAAGFWYLHEKEPKKATVAFEQVRDILYGEEMFLLAQTITQFQTATSPDTIAEIKIPNFPPEPHLRPITWKVLKGLRRVVEDTKLILTATSKSARSFALNRSIGQLAEILNNANTLPQAEKDLIVDIAQNWKKALKHNANDLVRAIGQLAEILNYANTLPQAEKDLIIDIAQNWEKALKNSITKPVNPYVIGDPVEGDLFVGREDIMRELEQLWVMSSQPQSVVLYGHRRMGKTSILRNIAKSSGADAQVIYVDLQSLEVVSQGMGEVFLAISDEISDSISLPKPDTEELLKLPPRTFKLYLKQAMKKLDNKSLIIALDEFETIENLIDTQQLPPKFMAVLRSFVQMSPKIAFAFAGRHTLEEMTQDYFQPFFAGV